MTTAARAPVPAWVVAVGAAIVAAALSGAVTWALASTGPAAPPQSAPAATAMPQPTPSPSDEPPDQAVAGRTPTPSVSPPGPVDVTVLTDPDAAEAAGAEAVLATGLAVAQRDWRHLAPAEWRPTEAKPVYAGRAELTPDRDAVAVDVVIALPAADDGEELVLRLLPAAVALDGPDDVTVEVSVEGVPVEARIDADGARLFVPVDPGAAGRPLLVRVRLGYDVPEPQDIAVDGTPASYGLLVRGEDVTNLGHWLPLLTLPSDAGPMLPRGDVGAFPDALWSLVVVHDDVLVTGGDDGDCPATAPAAATPSPAGDQRSCTWARGVALRDLSAAVVEDARVAVTEVDGVTLRAIASPDVDEDANATALQEAVAAYNSFGVRFGRLAWTQVDTVAAPLSDAAGMEFPGLSLIHADLYGQLDGGFGTHAVVHEMAHQWFHALVGNGSLSNPVVDESLAEYLTYLYWGDTFGAAAAEALAVEAFLNRYRLALSEGLPEDAVPARPLEDFASDEGHGALVYGRAGYGWVAAEDAVGRRVVEAFLADVVDRRGLDVVTADDIVGAATAFTPELGEILNRWWFDPAPIGDSVDSDEPTDQRAA